MNKFRPKTSEEKSEIIKLYDSGLSYDQVVEATGCSIGTIAKLVKGRRSHKEAIALARKNGRNKLTESGRQKLIQQGHKNVFLGKKKKFWTKPEQCFKLILNDLGLGVKFPDYIKDVLKVDDDLTSEIYYQYPIQRYVCDFVDIENKIVFRVNGDYWHANPILYEPEKLSKTQKFNVGRDENAKIFFETNGWNVFDVWESEIYYLKDVVKQRILATRKMVNPPLLQRGHTEFDSQVANLDLDWSNKLKSLWFKKPKEKSEKLSKNCEICDKLFYVFESKFKKRKYCSKECSFLSSRKATRPDKEMLYKLLWSKPLTKISIEFGVSDKTISNWAKDYGLEKPPWGFWARK